MQEGIIDKRKGQLIIRKAVIFPLNYIPAKGK